MGKSAKQLQHRFILTAMAFTGAGACLAGRASADAISPATAGAGTTPGIAYAASFGGGNAMAAEASLFIGGVLLVTLLCFGWLVYLMLTAPAEEGVEPTVERDTLPASHHGVAEMLGRSIRVRLGSLLGHAGPV